MTVGLAPFTAKGERPEWRILLEDVLTGCDYDDLITYEQLDEALGRDFRSNRSPLYRAAEELLTTQNKTLTAVANKGYRVVQPKEQSNLAKRDHKAGRRKIGRALRKVTHVERSRLTETELAEFERLQLGYQRMELAVRRLEVKQERQQQAIDTHTAEIDQLRGMQEQVARLQKTLEERGYLTEEGEQKT